MTQRTDERSSTATGIVLRFGAIAITMAVQAVLLFGGAGRLDWFWAWVYLGISLAAVAINGTIMLRTSPETIAKRGHAVCRSGPYRRVRHPGYVGMTLGTLAMPFLLGSLWALLPALAAVVAMVIRTRLEDRMLQAELPAYREYAEEVRCRPIPGIW
jgi:protein-S-isoprenylcysteine O-methyltransferase Ste14